MSVFSSTFSVVINSTDYSSQVVSISRKSDLCNPGQTFEIELNPSGSYSSLSTYQATVISENGTVVLTGYTSSISKERPPNKIVVKGSDAYKRCQDTFLDDTVITNGETITYWVNYLCTLAGVSYSIDGTGAGLYVYGNIPLGLRSVHEALTVIANYAGWVILVSADGVVHFTNIGATTDRIFYTLKGSRSMGDTDTRTSCIVWGMLGVNYRESRTVTGSGSGRVMVLAEPLITDTSVAQYIAGYLLNQFANLDDNLTIDVVGDPTIAVGQVAALDFSGAYTNTITGLDSLIDLHGYQMSVTMGRKCLNMAAITPSQGVVYAGTEYYLARSYNFYTSGSTLWMDVWGSSGSRSGLESFALDNYNPSGYGYASGSFGIARSTNLASTAPNWSIVYSPSQFQASRGDSLWSVTNIRSAQSQGLLYAQALSTGGSIWVGRSLDYGLTWSWSGALDVMTSASLYSSVPPLGFAVRGANEIWSTGNSGSLMYCSTGSASLNFRNIYTVPGSYAYPINNISTGGSIIYIGGMAAFAPYQPPINLSNYNNVSGVTNINNMLGAPDGIYGTVSPGGGFGTIPTGAVLSSGSLLMRLYSSTSGSSTLQLSGVGLAGQNMYLSGTQSPTPWFYLGHYPYSSFGSMSLNNVGSIGINIDAIEFGGAQGLIAYRNGTLTQQYVSSGTWLGSGHWKWSAAQYNSTAIFYVDNLYYGAQISITVQCIYEQYAIPTPPYYCYMTEPGSHGAFNDGTIDNHAMQNGETRTFTLTSSTDPTQGFSFSQGLSRYGEYQITSFKIDGTEIMGGAGVAYVKESSSGSAFTDITPATGGAGALRSLSSTDNNPSSVVAIGSTSGCVSGSLNVGTSWLADAGIYSNGNNLSQNGYNYQRVYWLDDYGIYYSGDFLSTSVYNKTGNWSDLYGYSFYGSGRKKVLVAQVVK